MDYHGRVMDLLPNAYFSKADIRGDAAAIAKEADMELAELRLDRQRKDAEIARLRDALGKIAKGRTGLDPEESDAEWRAYWASLCIDYRSMARAALAQVAEVGR